MKKKLELLMAVLMLCSVTACTESDKPKDDKKDKDKIAIVDKDKDEKKDKDKQKDKEEITDKEEVKDKEDVPAKEDKKEDTKPSEKPADKPSNPTPPTKPVEPEKPVTPPTKPVEPEKPVEPPKPQEPYITEDGRDRSWWPEEHKGGWLDISLNNPIFDTQQQAWDWALSVWETDEYAQYSGIGFRLVPIKYSNGTTKWSLIWYIPN